MRRPKMDGYHDERRRFEVFCKMQVLVRNRQDQPDD
jgi:hypothetical protein